MATQNLLSDQDFALLTAKAVTIGKPPELLLHQMIQEWQAPAVELPIVAKLSAKLTALQALLAAANEELLALKEQITAIPTQPQLPLEEILSKPPMTLEELDQLLFLEGKITHIPKGGVLTPEELEEREKLVQLFAGGKPASEMVIEDRGPY